MNLKYVESLATKAKNNDKEAIEKIINEFTPFILNISKKTYITGYDYNDINNECITYLLKAIKLYNPEKNSFVAYCTNAIKNNIKYLIKKNIKNKNETIEYLDCYSHIFNKDIDSNLIRKEEIKLIKDSIKKLSYEEYDLYTHLFVKNRAITEYAYINNLLYQTVYIRKKNLINKLYNSIK